MVGDVARNRHFIDCGQEDRVRIPEELLLFSHQHPFVASSERRRFRVGPAQNDVLIRAIVASHAAALRVHGLRGA
jgi:hypothetical protein